MGQKASILKIGGVGMEDSRRGNADFLAKVHVIACMVFVTHAFVAFCKAWVAVSVYDGQAFIAADVGDFVAGLMALALCLGMCYILALLTFWWCKVANVAMWLCIVLKNDFDAQTAVKCLKTGEWSDECIIVSDRNLITKYRVMIYAGLTLLLLLLPLKLTLPIVIKTFAAFECCISVFVLYIGLSLLYRMVAE